MSKGHFEDIQEQEAFSTDLNKRQPNPYSIDLAALQPTKSMILPMMEVILESVETGGIAPEELIVKLKFLQEVFSEVCSNLTDMTAVMVERNKAPLQILGAKIELAEVGISYKYDSDPVWSRLKEKAAPILQEIKDREALLKTLKKPMEEVDTETGEAMTIHPPIKTSKSSVKVTLGK